MFELGCVAIVLFVGLIVAVWLLFNPKTEHQKLYEEERRREADRDIP